MKNRMMDGIVFGGGNFQKIVIFELREISFTTENTEGTEGDNQKFSTHLQWDARHVRGSGRIEFNSS